MTPAPLLTAFLALLAAAGCMTQKQRHYTSTYEAGVLVERSYCTQRNTLIALFGENAELHKMTGTCGEFEGSAEQVGFNEQGRKALEGAFKAAVCAALPGPGCLVGRSDE